MPGEILRRHIDDAWRPAKTLSNKNKKRNFAGSQTQVKSL